MTNFSLTKISKNTKTGAIPVTYSHDETCPDTCALRYSEDGSDGPCFAKGGHVALHWRKLSQGLRGMPWSELIIAIRQLPRNQAWRHNIAGDLPHQDGEIDTSAADDLTRANKGKHGWLYSHHALNEHNLAIFRTMLTGGFAINHSADNARQAVAVFKEHKLPTVTILPTDAPNVQTIDGVKVVACPAEKSDRVTCSNCAYTMCANPSRKFIVGFRVHGNRTKKADIIARSAPTNPDYFESAHTIKVA